MPLYANNIIVGELPPTTPTEPTAAPEEVDVMAQEVAANPTCIHHEHKCRRVSKHSPYLADMVTLPEDL